MLFLNAFKLFQFPSFFMTLNPYLCRPFIPQEAGGVVASCKRK